jgi:hypothetical protein
MQRPPLDRRWLARWIAGSTLAYTAGGGAAVALVAAGHHFGMIGSHVVPGLLIGAMAGAISGITIGVLEAALLPRTVPRAAWIRGTLAGALLVWTLVALVPALLVDDPHGSARPLVARVALAMCVGASAGMLLTAFQAPALEVLSVRVRPWLLGNGAAWGTATPVTYVITGFPATATGTAISGLLLVSVAGVVGGAATALTLVLEERRAQLMGQSTGRTCATELL